MVALLEFYTHRKVEDMDPEDIGREFAKLVFVLDWQSKQANGRI